MQSRQLIHSDRRERGLRYTDHREGEPNLVINAVLVHDDQLMVAHKSLKVPLGGAHADRHGHAQQADTTSPAKKPASMCRRSIQRDSRCRRT